MAGEDAGAFLDALVTNDVSRATVDAPVYAGLLSPQGKVIADFIAFRAPDGALLLDVAAARAEALRQKLILYRLRRRIEIDDVAERLHVVIRTDTQPGWVADPRRPDGSLGYRQLAEAPPREIAPVSRYEASRIAAGVPDLAVDAEPEEIFALEALFEEFNGVDFQKGCFIGQENVSRMKRRATTRRKFCRVACEGAPPPFGAEILAGAASIGTIRSGIEGCAIAFLRLDRALEAGERNQALVAQGLTLRLDPPAWLIMPARGDD
ncbi:MAG: folate-binding protein YgfZ [Hyphomonadaceae bacterium]|nr:MAG: glycine cleavage system protein T [Caulobacteraceae bacterium]MBT9445009.1 folate-binding protein YgfZ [Hyphomonadaceae bacterium]TPW04304.1 MAG: glycine cleavage system protein T [Alphaproteobacteria bacterium]